MVRDFSDSNYCYFSSRSERISYSSKKIGSYFGKLKNTLSSFQREVNSVTDDIDIEKNITDKKNLNQDNTKKNNE